MRSRRQEPMMKERKRLEKGTNKKG